MAWTKGRPSQRASAKATMAPSMAPVQVIAVPRTRPNTMPLAIATNSAGNGTKECAAISTSEPAIPQPPHDRILAATRQLPPDRIGTCDDCGFAPFADDTSTSRDIAFAKIAARVEGTALAAQLLGL